LPPTDRPGAANYGIANPFWLLSQGRGSGASIEEEHGVVYEFREGLIARAVSYRDKAKPLEAAGIQQ
jgi:hypothetical protein